MSLLVPMAMFAAFVACERRNDGDANEARNERIEPSVSYEIKYLEIRTENPHEINKMESRKALSWS